MGKRREKSFAKEFEYTEKIPGLYVSKKYIDDLNLSRGQRIEFATCDGCKMGYYLGHDHIHVRITDTLHSVVFRPMKKGGNCIEIIPMNLDAEDPSLRTYESLYYFGLVGDKKARENDLD